MKSPLSHFLISLGLISIAGGIRAQDLPGSSDHPGVARFKGSVIRAQSRDNFDSYTVPLGPPDKAETKFQKQQNVEGKVLRTLYQASAGSTPLAIFRSYEEALRKGGFEVLYQCETKQCSPEGRLNYTLKSYGKYMGVIGGHSFDDDRSYLISARNPKTNVYAVVYATSIWGDPSTVYYTVDVVETKPLESGLVTVTAKTLADDILATGHAAIYGIYFDSGKAIVKPESKPVLVEIAKLLGMQPALKLFVVGHTDGIGTFASNMTLSKQRADAVVHALVTDYKVSAVRLQGNGVGPLVPVAPNSTDEGRAKNRRVELVAR